VTFVLGRAGGVDCGPTGRVGTYRALDGSEGAELHLDLNGPHAALVVGKRGYGKSYTLGVIAEELARTAGVAPVLVDPMGVFGSLAADSSGHPVPATVLDSPSVRASALGPRSWCRLLDLDPGGPAGSLVWRAASERKTLAGMRARVRATEAPDEAVRAADNHLRLAESWSVFDADGLRPTDIAGGDATVLDLSGLGDDPMNAIVRGVAAGLYRARVSERLDRLPWLLVDEAHAFFEGVAREALERLLTRGRVPGVSVVAATQRPGVVPAVAVSQSDLLFAHRLTAERDVDALAAARPSYLNTALRERLPAETGAVTILDDATETVHAARVRERATPHDGDAPTVTDSRDRVD